MEAERNAEEHYFPPGRSMARRVHDERERLWQDYVRFGELFDLSRCRRAKLAR